MKANVIFNQIIKVVTKLKCSQEFPEFIFFKKCDIIKQEEKTKFNN